MPVQVLARANRERLRVLLSEAEEGKLNDNERYAAALRYLCFLQEKIKHPLQNAFKSVSPRSCVHALLGAYIWVHSDRVCKRS